MVNISFSFTIKDALSQHEETSCILNMGNKTWLSPKENVISNPIHE